MCRSVHVLSELFAALCHAVLRRAVPCRACGAVQADATRMALPAARQPHHGCACACECLVKGGAGVSALALTAVVVGWSWGFLAAV